MQKSSPRWLDLPAIFFFLVAVLLSATRLSLTEWTPHLRVAGNLTIFGLLLGFALGYSHFKKIGVSLLTLGYSLTLLPWQIERILDPLLATDERIYEMSDRLRTGLSAFFARQPVKDTLVALVFFALLLWLIALYESYTLARFHNSLAAILPSALTILLIQYYDNRGKDLLWILGIFFFFLLAFFVRMAYLKNYSSWQEKHVFVVPDEKLDINLISIAAIGILSLVAWNIPSSSAEWERLSHRWDKATHRFTTARENIDNFFSSIDNPRPVAGSLFYGNELTLGEQSYQGNNEITVVQVPEIDIAPPRYYWRVRSYDTYLNGAWSSADSTTSSSLPAQTPLLIPKDPATPTAIFTFTNKAPTRALLITPSQTYWTDIDTQAIYNELPGGVLDLNLLRAATPLRDEESYSAKAAPLTPTVTQLREAGTDYPNWVTERYLQLPEDLPPSIPELASEITSGRVSPYDKARLITSYLRKEITYSESVPTPPSRRDPLEWFLFTWKEGYCNYSASTEVVLLRAVGIPARLAVGFAQGQANEDGEFVVLQKDAHAWPEVYFPEIGWVEFEPTLNQALLVRPLGEIAEKETPEAPLPDQPNTKTTLLPPFVKEPEEDIVIGGGSTKTLQSLPFWGMIALLTVAALFGIWQLNRKQAFLTRGLRSAVQLYEKRNSSAPFWMLRWLAWQEASPIARAFQVINRSLIWLGEEIPVHYTPRERATALQKLLPEEEENIQVLLDTHEAAIFTPDEGNAKLAQEASRAIRWSVIKRKL